MAKLERTYNIPLRREFMKAPSYKKAKKAITALKQFLAKHMKSDKILLGRNLNLKIWERGIKNPPHHIKVTVVRDDENVVRAELFGHKYEEPTKADYEKLAKEDTKKEAKSEKKDELDKELKDMDSVLKGKEKKTSDKKEEKSEDVQSEERPVEAKKPKAAPKKTSSEKASSKKKSEKSED